MRELLACEEERGELHFLCKHLTCARGHLAPLPTRAYVLLFLEQKVAVIRTGEVVLKETKSSDKFYTIKWF